MSKIALVDDDRNILTSVAMTLEAEGFEVETYNDGQQALDAFNKSCRIWRCWILDARMMAWTCFSVCVRRPHAVIS